ncbi:MAG: hypothetical protein AAB592_01945, partial [Patescibacteria group bacterium]
AIPLYYEDENGNVVNPADNDGEGRLSTFLIRMRAPCKSSEPGQSGDAPTADCERIELYPPVGARDANGHLLERDIEKDTEMFLWRADSYDKFGAVVPKGVFGRSERSKRIRNALPDKNTEIYSSLINRKQNNFDKNVIFDWTTHWGLDINGHYGSVYDYIFNITTEGLNKWSIWTTDRPSFAFEMFNPPVQNDKQPGETWYTVPYLEYQILVNRPISNTDFFFIGDVTIDGKRRVNIIRKKTLEIGSLADFHFYTIPF